MTTAAVVWTHEAAQDAMFSLEEVELDELRPDEVRVRLVATGVCHTDLSAASGVIPCPVPGVLGHEGAGVVEEIGSRVTTVSPGDHVLLTFTSCGQCPACRGGHPAHCRDHLRLNLLSGRRADGSATVRHRGRELSAHFFGQSSFAREALVDERSVVVLPPATTADELAVLAPLGCGLQTGAGAVLNVLRPRAGSTIAITGAGAVGLAAVMAARLTPATEVIAVDRVGSRLDLARRIGATEVVDTSRTGLTEALLELTGQRGLDLAVETTGNVTVLEQLIDSLAIGGECAVIGAPRAGSRASFDVNRLLPGRSVRGVTMGDSEPRSFIPLVVDAYRRGDFPIDQLQRRYAFEEINQAAADAASGGTVKPVLLF
ncbi:NAD(P)-dependent alcohol dehydrogenase [Saccharopolyspora phatthalungensis]|uniref:Aryl-alcohol dehydrogenase n=1 Tax=Saccharopolyspora phatthalungensis TaxID=664693 RepID=A0A840QF35_9PSEU|nr:NAD(P)-dependent alcohol dehydrogenase [Saccharopolyspora phatthalungensis]MBB5157199.1 aryl-alcohol dehydrogenase [Saccharopolyspora phatthalungensis]